ncbi:MAG: hypothetical protein V1928_04600 [Parcubacteria group bacterium]
MARAIKLEKIINALLDLKCAIKRKNKLERKKLEKLEASRDKKRNKEKATMFKEELGHAKREVVTLTKMIASLDEKIENMRKPNNANMRRNRAKLLENTRHNWRRTSSQPR